LYKTSSIILVGLYLAAIIIANITVALFGPSVVVINAFLFIGLDLTTRDRLHEHWQTGRAWKMGLLIAAGSLISWLLNRAVAPIALASCVAFGLSAIADTIVYTWLHDRPVLQRINGSNAVSALIDSIVFPTLAFSMFLPWIIAGQFFAKFLGGAAWGFILTRTRVYSIRKHNNA
jgi:uncharacterized PurR-regulated membrane protein YhhQ (DUF165 family)